ncbi:hypothetical protein ACFPIJ_38420 [Dactylosporangium cerinum]|uniref:Sel1 repeat family protein n=1 Tax=Dactylosporangium cerinum TaxID=1434730 RepID=A0ABV9W4V8_9ACTN
MSDQPTARQLLTLARAGDLEPILHLCDLDGDGDVLADKWLTVAADFGHDDADDLIDDALQVSSLRYDDDGSLTGEVHFELGVAYLTGGDGLPVDPELSRRHLTAAADARYPAGIQGGDDVVEHTRAALTGGDRSLFDEIYPPAT